MSNERLLVRTLIAEDSLKTIAVLVVLIGVIEVIVAVHRKDWLIRCLKEALGVTLGDNPQGDQV